MTTRAAALLAALALAACTPSAIPGTKVPDTAENREIYGVIRSYAEALEKRDVKGVLAQVADDYFDAGGTPSPEDDLDRAGLERALTADLTRVDSMKVDMAVKRIDVKGPLAAAEVYYDNYFRVITPNGPIAKRDSDLHQMRFKKVGPAWKITSGL